MAALGEAGSGRDPQEERQARLTAQRILADHLHYRPPTPRRWRQSRRADPNLRHWPDTRLDLTGAALVDLNLRDCRIGEARFDGATFTGDAWPDEQEAMRQAEAALAP
ncbi:pentapeptide repeat-containing protein [Nonomuraea muscovyensis]|uniref:pentapeptide repeat-containing protein n=1 Tax=Nonomuraea muscovyensis TaxID=1124761 RepID=UPI0033F866AF